MLRPAAFPLCLTLLLRCRLGERPSSSSTAGAAGSGTGGRPAPERVADSTGIRSAGNRPAKGLTQEKFLASPHPPGDISSARVRS